MKLINQILSRRTKFQLLITVHWKVALFSGSLNLQTILHRSSWSWSGRHRTKSGLARDLGLHRGRSLHLHPHTWSGRPAAKLRRTILQFQRTNPSSSKI